MVRSRPAATIRAQAARSRAGTPSDLARSQPVPAGTSPSWAGTPARRSALPTLLQVPSPPTATIRRKPRARAASARALSSPARAVSACSTLATPAARSASRNGCTTPAPRPLPDIGLKTTKTGSPSQPPSLGSPGVAIGRGLGGLELDQRLEGLQPLPHPHLAEGRLGDLGERERLV